MFKSGKTGIPDHSLIEIDLKRAERYKRIYSTIKQDPRIRIPEINSIVPLPPAPLPEWDGSFSFQRQPSAQ
ncbi:DUF6396 domain-containing protein [Comamonas sp. NoAH]|uniref:DUF6396 domain-containing protein n=1 Tax=Comamonas halotolerans TaxID=3041496 RepID=UPI0032E9FEB3